MPFRAAAILAGGESRRFGADKALADFNGAPLIARVAAVLAADRLAVVGHPRAAILLDAADLRDPPDAVAGPLAGVLAALDWGSAIGADWVLTAPCDTPLLPGDLYERLVEAGERTGAQAAHACVGDHVHALCAVWRPALTGRLRDAFARREHPPVRALAPDAVLVGFSDSAGFANINTMEDLKRARERPGDG
jgi:molybdopterin-guanine dinucleotide biosynthesis protein A